VIDLKAKYWNSWERYLPREANAGKASPVRDCLKPWEQLFPIEGVEEAMSGATEPWRAWERYLPSLATIASTSLSSVSESLEEIQV
jgi:hypothetical protein